MVALVMAETKPENKIKATTLAKSTSRKKHRPRVPSETRNEVQNTETPEPKNYPTANLQAKLQQSVIHS